MQKTNTYTKALAAQSFSKWDDYKMLVKVKLSVVVVITSMLAYAVVAGSQFSFIAIAMLGLGGFLTTAAANAMNQVLEKDFDKLMTRTADRPITAGRMKASEAVMFAGIACLLGISILALFNPITALLGMISFITYAFIYTPLKRYSTIAVAVGALPGALPVMIGFTAFEGTISLFALSLFAIQFLWQFPHFWSIGFLAFDDYNNAGYKLLPSTDDKVDRNLGKSSIVYTLMLLPVVLALFWYGLGSLVATIVVIACTLVYTYFSVQFHLSFDKMSAKKLMFCSFFYMPAVLLAYMIF